MEYPEKKQHALSANERTHMDSPESGMNNTNLKEKSSFFRELRQYFPKRLRCSVKKQPTPPQNHDSISSLPITQPRRDFATLLKNIAALLPLGLAYAFLLSVTHFLIFLYTLGIHPLYIPTTFSDYVMSFSAWAIPFSYLLMMMFVSTIGVYFIKLPRNLHLLLTLGIICSLIYITFSILLNAYDITSAFVLAIISIFLYILIAMTAASKQNFQSDAFNLLMLFTAMNTVFFMFDIKMGIAFPSAEKQFFSYKNTEYEGYLLRSLEKGTLIRTEIDAKPYVIFLPNGAFANILKFPAKMDIPAQKN